jgi:hypothetical protein
VHAARGREGRRGGRRGRGGGVRGGGRRRRRSRTLRRLPTSSISVLLREPTREGVHERTDPRALFLVVVVAAAVDLIGGVLVVVDVVIVAAGTSRVGFLTSCGGVTRIRRGSRQPSRRGTVRNLNLDAPPAQTARPARTGRGGCCPCSSSSPTGRAPPDRSDPLEPEPRFRRGSVCEFRADPFPDLERVAPIRGCRRRGWVRRIKGSG